MADLIPVFDQYLYGFRRHIGPFIIPGKQMKTVFRNISAHKLSPIVQRNQADIRGCAINGDISEQCLCPDLKAFREMVLLTEISGCLKQAYPVIQYLQSGLSQCSLPV